MENPPVLFDKKENCCGCTACFSVCPKAAIEMKPDDEGFLYPIINFDRCVCCYRCIEICPIKAVLNP